MAQLRGHLSRSACRHVKQRAKRSGPFSCEIAPVPKPCARPFRPLREGARMMTPRKSRDPQDACAPATQLVHGGSLRSQLRRDLGGDVPDPGLSLRHDGAGRGALQGRRAGLHLFALRQPDRRDVRAPHGAARGRRSGARHRQRHGGGDRGADGPAQGRRSRRRRQGAVRLVSLCRRGAAAALRRRLDAGRRRRSRRLARRDAPQHQDDLPRKPDQPDAGDHRHRRASPKSPTSSARRWSSTMSSRRRCCSIR